jgi:hypothetical protein
LGLELGQAQLLGFGNLFAAAGDAQGQGAVLGVGSGDGSTSVRSDQAQNLLELVASHGRRVLVLLFFQGDAANLASDSVGSFGAVFCGTFHGKSLTW